MPIFNITPYRATAVSVKAYGAKGDGVTDDQSAITAAFAANVGGAVYFPAGVYLHSGILTATSCVVFGDSASSELRALSASSALYLAGSAPVLSNMRINTNGVSRLSAYDNCSVAVTNADGFYIQNNIIEKSSSAGVMLSSVNCKNGYVGYNTVQNTLADGIHHTHGANSITVEYNTTYNTGDDGIAVVSYGPDPVTTKIFIQFNSVNANAYGRGITVVGGENVHIFGNTLRDVTTAGGIYIGSEPAYQTRGVSAVNIFNNILTNCGNAGVNQGAIHLYNGGGIGGQLVHSVNVKNNTIYNAVVYPFMNSGYNPISASVANNKAYGNAAFSLLTNLSGVNDMRMNNNVCTP